MYHRVLPDSHRAVATEQPGMFVSPDTLEKNIRWLRQFCTIVDLADWIRDARLGCRLPPVAAAITFDDGWADNFDHALPVLRSLAAPATVFVCPSLVDSGSGFWPSELANILAHPNQTRLLPAEIVTFASRVGIGQSEFDRGLATSEADLLIERCKELPDTEMHELVRRMRPRDAPACEATSLLNWDQMRFMQSTGLVKIGCHTGTHLRLATVSDESALRREIVESKQTLESRLGRPILGFAYPNGETSAMSVGIVREAYSFAVTTRRGGVRSTDDMALLRRVPIQEGICSQHHGFLSRLAGVG